MLVSILVGLGLGYGVDRLTHHGPIGMLAGIFLGFAAGLYSIYKAMMADADDASRSSDGHNHGPPGPP